MTSGEIQGGRDILIYLLQLREAAAGHLQVLALFTVFATIVWAQWAYKTLLSRRYHPYTTGPPTALTTTVIIPVVDEPVDLFTDVLTRIQAQTPDEILVVINGPPNSALEQICKELDVTWHWTATPGKRNAIRVGVEHATGDVAVLVDSDTLWTPGCLAELCKPFADQAVGGVTTRQRILDAYRWQGPLPIDQQASDRQFTGRRRPPFLRVRRRGQLTVARFIRRWCDWLENSRALYSLPAQSSCGYVACLPGRTIAFRSHILRQVMPEFMGARFLGVHLEVSDDRHLTNLCLKAGWRTVYQSTSLVYTDAPLKLRKLYKQQLRWARGSQYNHLRMFPWVVQHAPLLIPFYAVDIVLPFLLVGAVFSWAWRAVNHTGINLTQPILHDWPGPAGWLLVAAAIVAGSTLSMWLRQLRHLVEVPADLAWMPFYILFSSFFLMPVRVIGFFVMAHTAGWGTRNGGYDGHNHRLNPKATIPYVVGALVLGAELAVVVHT